MILDPMFQLTKHDQMIVQTLFLEDDLVLFAKSVIQRVTNNEMSRIYYIPIKNDNYVINAQSDILDNLLPFIIP